MTEIPNISANSLTAAIDEQIARLKATQLPSLRAVHSARQQALKLSYDRDREQQLTVRASNHRPTHPGHRDVAESWIEMLQAVLRPAELLTLKADVMPSKKGALTETAAYFAATIMAVSNWPLSIPYPEGADLYAVLSVKLSKEGGETVGHISVDIGAALAEAQSLESVKKEVPSLAEDRGYYWQRCCQAMTPWFEDGGIKELSILVPMRPAGTQHDFGSMQNGPTIH